MNNCRRYEKKRIINIILEDHFENFKETKLKLLKNKDMREHIKNVVEKALNCGNPKYRYIMYKCVSCNEEYIHGFSRNSFTRWNASFRMSSLWSKIWIQKNWWPLGVS